MFHSTFGLSLGPIVVFCYAKFTMVYRLFFLFLSKADHRTHDPKMLRFLGFLSTENLAFPFKMYISQELVKHQSARTDNEILMYNWLLTLVLGSGLLDEGPTKGPTVKWHFVYEA